MQARVSRWPCVSGVIAGPEETLLGGNNNMWCSQFTSAGLNDILTGPDNMIYISAGVGANKNAPVVRTRVRVNVRILQYFLNSNACKYG